MANKMAITVKNWVQTEAKLCKKVIDFFKERVRVVDVGGWKKMC